MIWPVAAAAMGTAAKSAAIPSLLSSGMKGLGSAIGAGLTSGVTSGIASKAAGEIAGRQRGYYAGAGMAGAAITEQRAARQSSYNQHSKYLDQLAAQTQAGIDQAAAEAQLRESLSDKAWRRQLIRDQMRYAHERRLADKYGNGQRASPEPVEEGVPWYMFPDSGPIPITPRDMSINPWMELGSRFRMR